MAENNRGMTACVLLVAALSIAGSSMVTDRTGAHLQLAPVFVGAALAAVLVLAQRARSRRRGR